MDPRNPPGSILGLGGVVPKPLPKAQQKTEHSGGLDAVLGRIEEKAEETAERRFKQGYTEAAGAYERIRTGEPVIVVPKVNVGTHQVALSTLDDTYTVLDSARTGRATLSCDALSKGVLTRMGEEALTYADRNQDIAAFIYAFQVAKITDSLGEHRDALFTLLKRFAQPPNRRDLCDGLENLGYAGSPKQPDGEYFAAFEQLARETGPEREAHEFGKQLMKDYLVLGLDPVLLATKLTREKGFFRTTERREEVVLPYSFPEMTSLARERAGFGLYFQFLADRSVAGEALIIDPQTKGMLCSYGQSDLRSVDPSESMVRTALANLYLGDGLEEESVVKDILALVERDVHTQVIQQDLSTYRNK